MSASTTVPVVIAPEAAARVAELGMQAELQQMLDHVRQVFPDLTHIEVSLNERYDTGGEPGVAIDAFVRRAWVPEDRACWDLGTWQSATFPPRVCEHLLLDLRYEDDRAG